MREQAISFILSLTRDEVYFTTIKFVENPRTAKDLMDFIIRREKSLKSTYTKKFEYFYVLAKHNFSGWHIHIISNRKFNAAEYSESVRERKNAALYIVKNLVMSRCEDYEGVRRYGGSALLYKQNKKTGFKNRIRYWRYFVLSELLSLVLKALRILVLALMTMALRTMRYPLPYRVDLGNVAISQAQRNYRGRTEELVFRKPRDDLIGESEQWQKSVTFRKGNLSNL